MKTTEIKKHLNEATYMFSETDNDTLLFWEEAVKKVPQMVIEEITSLVEFTKTDKQFGDPLGFSFYKEYKEIFAPLNLTLRYDE